MSALFALLLQAAPGEAHAEAEGGAHGPAEVIMHHVVDTTWFGFPSKHLAFVFVVEEVSGEIGTARRKAVRVGELSSDGIAIEEGLSDGDLLVTAGVNKLVDGRKVKLLSRAGSER